MQVEIQIGVQVLFQLGLHEFVHGVVSHGVLTALQVFGFSDLVVGRAYLLVGVVPVVEYVVLAWVVGRLR